MVEGKKKNMESYFLVKKGIKERCCGCAACYSICPVEAIEMITDEEGFEYPFIKDEICIKCNMCKKVCPIGGFI